MAEIRPFRALRYRETDSKKFRELIAPPYDVISREKRKVLLDRSPHNCIRLILGDPSTLSDEELRIENRYSEAAQTMTDWIAENTIGLDDSPSIYVQEDRFEWEGKERSRIGFYALVQLEEFGSGSILPHEKTNKGPIEDRRRLMAATKTHTSPIFMVFDDRNQEVQRMLAEVIEKASPDLSFDNPDEETSHRFWRVSRGGWINQVVKTLKNTPLLIADGHHRYTTALHYSKNEGKDFPESRWMLVYLCPAPNDGVVLSSIQRLVKTEMSAESLEEKLNKNFRTKKIQTDWNQFLKSEAEFAVHLSKRQEIVLAYPKKDALDQVEKDLRTVPTVVLNQLVFKDLLNLDLDDPAQQKRVQYIKSQKDASIRESEKDSILFWVKPMTTLQTIDVARKGHVLPQKSTFFFPKVMTGFVMHRLMEI